MHHGRPRGRSWFRGRFKWFPGAYDSPESREAYEDLVREWERDRQTADHAKGLTVAKLALQYVEFAEAEYTRDGKATNELHNLRTVLRWLVKLFRSARARDFHAGHLESFQSALVESGRYNRRTINQHASRVRRVFKWAIARRLVPADVLVSLQCIRPLAAGRRTTLRERRDVPPVPLDVVEATIPELSRHLAGAVRFQLHTGCRPGEALMLRECDVDAESTSWLYRPKRHKTEHKGKHRLIALGPKARAIVQEYLVGDPRAHLFSPDGTLYTQNAYRQCIHRAYLRAILPDELRKPGGREVRDVRRRRLAKAREWKRDHASECWNPNQLRHTFGTEVRRLFGFEAAQLMLGHADSDATQIYAERDLAKAREIAEQLG